MENQIVTTQPNTAIGEVTLFSNFDKLVSIADYLSKSDILPATFKDKPANVFIALDMAQRMGMNPFMVCQNIYMVHGKPAWSSSFLIACINACGKFSNLEFEFRNIAEKGGLGCRAIATRLSDGKVLEGSWITMAMAQKEGWASKPGSKWQTMPEQMLRYRAAAFWQRAFAPEVSMGIRDEEEIRDMASVQDAQYTEVVDAPTTVEDKAKKQIERRKVVKEAPKQTEEPTTANVEEPKSAEVVDVKAVAEETAGEAAVTVAADHKPFKGIFGTWMVWDEEKQDFVDSGKETI